MSKIVKLTSAIEREEKLNEIYENLEELKKQFTALIDEYEEEKSDSRKVDTLIGKCFKRRRSALQNFFCYTHYRFI